jgi:putative spermidine/putrescine transport system permease protein
MAERETTVTPFQVGEVVESGARAPALLKTRLPVLLLLAPALAVTLVFLVAPVVFLLFISFTAGRSFLQAVPTFTLTNYTSIFTDYLENLRVSLGLALLATLVNLVFGFPFAYILIRKVQYRDIVRAFMIFPMFGALYIAFGMRFLLLSNGMFGPLIKALNGIGIQIPIYGLHSVIFAMAIFTFPFMVMNIGAALSNIDPKLEEAALCLGAKRWQTFVRVLLPLAMPGILAGVLMCFGWNIGAFAEPVFLGGVAEQRAIAWTMYQRGIINFDFGLASAMGIVLMMIAFAVTYFSLRFSRGALAD